jgi:hypothetical protein
MISSRKIQNNRMKYCGRERHKIGITDRTEEASE